MYRRILVRIFFAVFVAIGGGVVVRLERGFLNIVSCGRDRPAHLDRRARGRLADRRRGGRLGLAVQLVEQRLEFFLGYFAGSRRRCGHGRDSDDRLLLRAARLLRLLQQGIELAIEFVRAGSLLGRRRGRGGGGGRHGEQVQRTPPLGT